MEEKQVKKPSAGYAVFVGILGASLIAALFGDFKMIFSSEEFASGSFIDLVRSYIGLIPAIAAGGNDVKQYIYDHVGEMCLGLAAVGCLITYFVHVVRYLIACANFKEESDTRRMTSNLAGFTYTGLIYSAISVLIVLGFVKNDAGKIVYAVIPGWGGLLAIVASVVGLIVLIVKAGKDERKLSVLKSSGALTVLFVSLCALLTYATLFDFNNGIITPFEVLRETLYSMFTGGDASPLAIGFVGGALVLMFATLILYKGIVRNVLETKAYFKEEKKKKYNPHIRIFVYGLVATVLYAVGGVLLFLGKLQTSQPSIVFYVAAGLHILPLIFAIVYFVNYGKNRPLPINPPKEESEEEEEESSEEREPAKEEEAPKAEEAPVEEEKVEEKPQEEEAPKEEEKPAQPYFDFFKPVSKTTTDGAALGAAPVEEEKVEEKPVEDEPIMEINGEALRLEEEEPHVEEVKEVIPEDEYVEAPVEEEVPDEEVEEEEPVEESAEEAAPAKKDPAKKAASKKSSDPGYRTYHLVKRDDGKWEVKFAGGQKAIKLFDTQKEAVEYAKVLSENQGGTYLVHNSKGANKGRIQKK